MFWLLSGFVSQGLSHLDCIYPLCAPGRLGVSLHRSAGTVKSFPLVSHFEGCKPSKEHWIMTSSVSEKCGCPTHPIMLEFPFGWCLCKAASLFPLAGAPSTVRNGASMSLRLPLSSLALRCGNG